MVLIAELTVFGCARLLSRGRTFLFSSGADKRLRDDLNDLNDDLK